MISGVLEELSFANTMAELEKIKENEYIIYDNEVKLHSIKMYKMIVEFEKALEDPDIARVETKYQTVAKKVKPIAAPLPKDSDKILDKASKEKILREPSKIGHKFTKETLEEVHFGEDFLSESKIKCFKEMIVRHGKTFAFQPNEIGCVDPNVVAPMVVFTIPHLPWNLRPIPVPKAHLSKLIDLLNEKEIVQ